MVEIEEDDPYVELGRQLRTAFDRSAVMFFLPYMGSVDHAAIQEFLHLEGVPCHLPDCPACYNRGLGQHPYLASLSATVIMETACTYRERVFSRLFSVVRPTDNPKKIEIRLYNNTIHRSNPGATGSLTGTITRPKQEPFTAKALLSACLRNASLRAQLKAIPFRKPAMYSTTGPLAPNDELDDCLQDLGDIVAHEANEAWTEKYYPGIPDIRVPAKHVPKVIAALQRELTREGASRRKHPLQLSELPLERQVALAERRRWWFKRFGITPRTWKTGLFDVTKVDGSLLKEADFDIFKGVRPSPAVLEARQNP